MPVTLMFDHCKTCNVSAEMSLIFKEFEKYYTYIRSIIKLVQ